MRKANLVGQPDGVAASVAEGCGRPLADAVERQNGGFVEWRREKRAGRVRLVMIGEDDAAVILAAERCVQFALRGAASTGATAATR